VVARDAEGWSNLRIIDLSHFLAGAIPGMIFADLGAEVIKVESFRRPDGLRRKADRPGSPPGPPEHPASYNLWRGKKSVALDFKVDRDRSLLIELIDNSDVVIENFSPGVLERVGLDSVSLRASRPRLITANVRAVLEGEPYSLLRSGAPGIHATVGVDSVMGYEDGENVVLGRPTADILAGFYAYLGIAAAIRRREMTGEGAHVEVGLDSATLGAFSQIYAAYSATGRRPGPTGNVSAVAVPHNFFRCNKGSRWISLSVQAEEEWHALVTAMGSPTWASDAAFADRYRRSRNRVSLEQRVATWLWDKDAHELVNELQAHGVAAVLLTTPGERLADEHFAARGMYTWVEHPTAGRQPLFNTMWHSDAQEPVIRGPAPELGADTRHVLETVIGVRECATDDGLDNTTEQEADCVDTEPDGI
jgi:crotonobetainyl-CoA:carnitine CoA-transferase CaiB-like acyl-CoA transferase